MYVYLQCLIENEQTILDLQKQFWITTAMQTVRDDGDNLGGDHFPESINLLY